MDLHIDDIQRYSVCPMLYKYSKEEEIRSVDYRYEKALQKAVYSYMSSIQNEGRARVSTLFSSFGSNWIGKNKTINEMLFSEPTTWRDRENIKRKQGLAALDKFHRQVSTQEYEVLAINVPYKYPLTKSINVTGEIEVARGINGYEEIIVFITGDRNINSVEVNNNLKVISSLLGYNHTFSKDLFMATLYGFDKGKIHPVSVMESHKSIFKRNVVNIAKCIHNNIFYQSPSKECVRCPFYSKCK